MEKSKSIIVSASIFAIGIIIAGWMLSAGVRHFKDSERVVVVKGVSERQVSADRVIWPLTYKQVGNNLPQLYTTIESTNTKIVNFLTTNGISIEEITIAPAEVFDNETERYRGPDMSSYRYNVTAVITVSTDKVDKVVALMSRQSDLLKQGIAVSSTGDYRYATQFDFTSNALTGIKPAMIEEATKNARTAGEKFAVDSQSELGKIKTANQGQFTISDRDANTPSIKIVRVVTTVEYYLKD
ncbi:MAG: SIMPL domain-containing protein [Rikenellaceae bacterium]